MNKNTKVAGQLRKSIMDNQEDARRGADKKEAFHQAAEANVHTFSFKRPEMESPKGRIECQLAGSDSCNAIIEVLKKDWSGSLHYHPNQDGIWLVLKGHVRFYGPDGV